MDSLCPVVEGSTETARDHLTLGAILRAFLPVLPPLLKLGNHKLRVLWHLAACGTPALGANLFACPHCPHRHWAPRSCGDQHCPRCLAAKSCRNSSGGLYRCRRHSPHDRRRANAMRFLMKTLRARKASRLIHAFRQNRLWIRSAALLSSCRLLSPAWAIWLTGSPQIALIDLLTAAPSSFSKLLLSNTRFTNPTSPQSGTRSLTVLFPYA